MSAILDMSGEVIQRKKEAQASRILVRDEEKRAGLLSVAKITAGLGVILVWFFFPVGIFLFLCAIWALLSAWQTNFYQRIEKVSLAGECPHCGVHQTVILGLNDSIEIDIICGACSEHFRYVEGEFVSK